MAIVGLAIYAFIVWSERAQSPSLVAQTQPSRTGPTAPVDAPRGFDMDNLTIDPAQIHDGGPGKDGIPALTTSGARRAGARYAAKAPQFTPAGDIEALAATDRLVVVTVGKSTRAYPINVLNFHEVVNDVVGGKPIVVVYCPLCDSATVMSREFGDKTYEFGVSGMLYNSNVLLYDRTDHALWSQAAMSAISGPNAGKSLDHLDNWSIERFGPWAKANPGVEVLSPATGYRRPYRRNPYAGYFDHDRLMFPVNQVDDRLPRKTRVIGVRSGELAMAYPIDTLADAPGGKLVDQFAGGPVELHADDAGVRIVRLPDGAAAMHTFWFAWAANRPDTAVYGQPE